MRDLHQAPKIEIIQKARAGQAGVDFLLVRHQWGKSDAALSLHAEPNQFTTAGLQTPDFLALSGFERGACSFTQRECFARWVSESFAADAFATAFDQAFVALGAAEDHLQACGFLFEQMEGWGYFFGKRSRGRYPTEAYGLGDGHAAAESQVLKRAEDAVFEFLFSWNVTGDGHKGWVTHYRAKNPPISADLEAALRFLRLKRYSECPHFDFEPCWWTGLLYEERSESFFDRNTEFAHRCFDAHAPHFTPGLQNLLTAHGLMERFGMKILPFADAAKRRQEDIARHTNATPAPADPKRAALPEAFEVAISFAGTERAYAKELALALRAAGINVFYDDFYPEMLWGKDLVAFFDDIYRKRSRYCVMFISQEYANRMWTNHERRSAQARGLQEKGQEYILPIKVDETELPGMPPTTGYVSLAQYSIEQIAQILINKLRV
jgi:hypothetical protein